MYWRTMIATAMGLGMMGMIPCYPVYSVPYYTPLLAFAVPLYFSIAVFIISCGVLLDAAFKYPSKFSATTGYLVKALFDAEDEWD